jgi:hypothetical protein
VIQNFNHCFNYGKKAEYRFTESYLTYVKYPTKEQDMFEHWDVEGVCIQISDKHYKFDVKSTERLKYSTPDKIMEDVWIEAKNVRGNDGWIKGIADYIVFEREKSWFIVNRIQLLNLTRKKVKENNCKKGKGRYLLHTRVGRKDLVTQIPFTDMKTIEHYQLLKRN